jgi:hypothetical protein
VAESRPEWTVCIADGVEKAWCRRSHGALRAFPNVDAAAQSGRRRERLVACADCVREVYAAMRGGQAPFCQIDEDRALVARLCEIDDGLSEWEVRFVESVARQVLDNRVMTATQRARAQQIEEDRGR